MNSKEQIKTIESKILEIKSILETWTEQIANYYTVLNQITEQLEEIKKNINPDGVLK